MSRQSSSSPIRPGAGAALAGLLRRATLAEYRHDIRKIRREVQEGGSIAVTKAGPIEYASEGRGAPALIIHGATGGYDQGLLLARSFAPAGVRTIAPSRFGYLRTPLPADATQMHPECELVAIGRSKGARGGRDTPQNVRARQGAAGKVGGRDGGDLV